MTVYSSFQYWLSVAADPDGSFQSTFDALNASGEQLTVLETGVTISNTSDTTNDVLTASQIATLIAQGRTVLGYVNATVTDHNRTYWDDAWIIPEDRDGPNPDAGTPGADAPDWLADPIGLATGPGDEVFGPIVNFRDPEWQAIVIADAVAIIEAGYSGVFIDDVLRYFQDGDAPLTNELAGVIMRLVNDISDAVHAVNPDAQIVTNNGFSLRFDADPDAGNSLDWWEYLSNVDGVLFEYVEAGNTIGDWTQFTDNYFDLPEFFYIIDDDLIDTVDLPAVEAEGVTIEIVPDPDYAAAPPSGTFTPTDASDSPTQQQVFVDEVLTTIYYGTDGDDVIDLSGLTTRAIIYGLDGDDTIIGTAFDDLIFAGSGDDVVDAGNGDDYVLGAAGADHINGGTGADVIEGSSGSDSLFGDDGADTLAGGADGDLLSGGNGNDFIYGGDLPDTFVFDI